MVSCEKDNRRDNTVDQYIVLSKRSGGWSEIDRVQDPVTFKLSVVQR